MILSTLNRPLQVSGDLLGSPLTLTFSVGGSPLTVAYRCGTRQGVVAEKTRKTSITWVPPVELAEEYPALQRIPVELTLTLYRGNQPAETRQEYLLLGLPPTEIPQGKLVITDDTGTQERCGGFVQGVSQALISVEAQGSAGAPIARCRLYCGQLRGEGTRACFPLPQSGQIPVRAELLDTRGRGATLEATLSVLPRTPPQGAILSLEEWTETEETPQAGGSWRVHALGKVTALPGLKPVFTLKGKKETGEDAVWDLGENGTMDTVLVIPKVRELTLLVGDGLETLEFPWGNGPLLDLDIAHRSLGLGCRGETAQTVTLGMPVDFRGNRLQGLPPAQNEGDPLPLGQAQEEYLSPRLLWENPNPQDAFLPGEIQAQGALFAIEFMETAGGARFWEIVGAFGFLRGKASGREVILKSDRLAFGPGEPDNSHAIPLKILRLLPGKEGL
mgnify:FL=1